VVDSPFWHNGSVESVQSVSLVQVVVQAATTALCVVQLKHVVPAAQGCPHSGTNVVHFPWTHDTPPCSLNAIVDPSSVVVGPVAHPQAG
jgi:hypothetical protein